MVQYSCQFCRNFANRACPPAAPSRPPAPPHEDCDCDPAELRSAAALHVTATLRCPGPAATFCSGRGSLAAALAAAQSAAAGWAVAECDTAGTSATLHSIDETNTNLTAAASGRCSRSHPSVGRAGALCWRAGAGGRTRPRIAGGPTKPPLCVSMASVAQDGPRRRHARAHMASMRVQHTPAPPGATKAKAAAASSIMAAMAHSSVRRCRRQARIARRLSSRPWRPAACIWPCWPPGPPIPDAAACSPSMEKRLPPPFPAADPERHFFSLKLKISKRPWACKTRCQHAAGAADRALVARRARKPITLLEAAHGCRLWCGCACEPVGRCVDGEKGHCCVCAQARGCETL